jgi:hypothetical protein
MTQNTEILVKVKNQLDATKYAALLPQHVSGTNMPIIRSKITFTMSTIHGHMNIKTENLNLPPPPPPISNIATEIYVFMYFDSLRKNT